MKHSCYLIFGILFLVSCTTSKPRRPINPKPSTTIFQDNIETTKRLFQLEKNEIIAFIKKDTSNEYKTSSNGFWYTYITKVEADLAMPKIGDIVELQYDIRDLNNTIIYSKEVLGTKNYKVDKEDFIAGIQKGIKLMKIGETITFVFPSYNAFGISGDGNKIGINKTIKSRVTLLNIK
ncbi:gliding motility-associated peptidyl-prolyl isomerase GldI [Polaribacter sp. IC073]|uniref:gliding motility-associated peptidyl-prolyl isomerase GldI n=1 Tax=Polaribacter sp. IC073 TaxID=2508540 RepID=UPI0011BFE347|nr:gliding motility-associated peptidyl-prolyl isomerase GldI [Polaribacter sp. IC073]TXD49054.1 gliding motility-associated peptidyl-prolyl isomerase GldI [Polaribacter sp. IC073]